MPGWPQGEGPTRTLPGELPTAAKGAGRGPVVLQTGPGAGFRKRSGSRRPRGEPRRHLWPAHRHCTCLLTLNIGSGRRRGHRACRATGAGQSAAESPSGGAAGPGPAPVFPMKQGTPLPQARVCSKCPPTSLSLQPTAPCEGLTSSAGTWARGGASPGSSGVWDKYLWSECCFSPAGSAA